MDFIQCCIMQLEFLLFVVEQASESILQALIRCHEALGISATSPSFLPISRRLPSPRHCTKKVEWGGGAAAAVAVIDGDAVIRHRM